ncbi:hypothetical protein HZB07_03250 [Candidatus Saganbacteria bacterium]|nr:hypothetical protein [Candidatus Saganbacteria bacterium]
MKKGAALLIAILLTGLFLMLAVFSSRIVYNAYNSVNAAWQREQAYWLAEAGLEKGKQELGRNLNWYTDLPYYLVDNVAWLVRFSVGEETDLGEGAFKIVKEKGRDCLYAIGSRGKALVVLKLTFAAGSLRIIEWREL